MTGSVDFSTEATRKLHQKLSLNNDKKVSVISLWDKERSFKSKLFKSSRSQMFLTIAVPKMSEDSLENTYDEVRFQ